MRRADKEGDSMQTSCFARTALRSASWDGFIVGDGGFGGRRESRTIRTQAEFRLGKISRSYYLRMDEVSVALLLAGFLTVIDVSTKMSRV